MNRLPRNRSQRGWKPPPDYLSRTVQRQLLLLVGLLLLVLLLMKVAARPESWAWMWRSAPAGVESGVAETPDDRLPSASEDAANATGVDERAPGDPVRSGTPASEGLPPGRYQELLESIQDDTYFRSEETEAWFHFLTWLRDSCSDEVEATQSSATSSLQLLRQMPAYRGRLVQVRGQVLRVSPIPAPENTAGFTTYWRCWLQDAAGTAPIVVYLLQLPDGFPTGTNLRESAEFTGIAYKRWAYQAQGGLMAAPVVLRGPRAGCRASSPATESAVSSSQIVLGIGGVVLLSLVLVRWVFSRGRAGPRLPLCVAFAVLTGIGPVAQAQQADDPPRRDFQEILKLYELDASHWQRFVGGESLRGEEREPLFRLLYVLPRLRATDVQRWAIPLVDPSTGVPLEEPVRGQLYSVQGDVVSVEQLPLPDETAARFQFSRYFRVTLVSPGEAASLVVYAREIPAQWSTEFSSKTSLGPASATAVFLKRGARSGNSPELLLAASRVAWHPHQVNAAGGVDAGMALLGAAGMDVGLFDQLVQRQPLRAEDRECFYQILSAVGNVDPAAPAAVASEKVVVERLLQDPQDFTGRLLTVTGTARRAIRIEVDDADIRDRFAIDHYYELELFHPLAQPLKLIDSRDGQSRLYSSFPISVCLRHLPRDIPRGAEIRHEVQVTGFFLKLWSYRSQFMDPSPGERVRANVAARRQISPLLMGIAARSVERRIERPGTWGWGLAVGVLAAGVACAVVCRAYRRGDQAFLTWKQRQNSPPAGDDHSGSDAANE